MSLALALRRPDLVRTLTMMSSGPGYRDPEARENWNRYVDRAVERMPVAPMVAGLARQEDSWVIDHVGELEPPLLIVVGERDERFQPGAAFLHRSRPRQHARADRRRRSPPTAQHTPPRWPRRSSKGP